MPTRREIVSGLGVILMTWGFVEVSKGGFSRKQKDKHGQAVGWRCEYPGCGEKLAPADQEFHHKVPVARGKKIGLPPEEIDSTDNMELDCLRHHLARHEEMGDRGGVAWILERIRRKQVGYGKKRH